MMRYLYDRGGHLVCVPYTARNMREVASELGIDPRRYHSSARYPHYDITSDDVARLAARCELVSNRQIISVVRTGTDVDAGPCAGVPR